MFIHTQLTLKNNYNEQSNELRERFIQNKKGTHIFYILLNYVHKSIQINQFHNLSLFQKIDSDIILGVNVNTVNTFETVKFYYQELL